MSATKNSNGTTKTARQQDYMPHIEQLAHNNLPSAEPVPTPSFNSIEFEQESPKRRPISGQPSTPVRKEHRK